MSSAWGYKKETSYISILFISKAGLSWGLGGGVVVILESISMIVFIESSFDSIFFMFLILIFIFQSPMHVN